MVSVLEPRVMPFSALVGQEPVKMSLLMLAVSPRLGGVLIRGDKGTAKSTAARGLAELLPLVRARAGCRFRCAVDRPEQWCAECRARDGVEAVELAPAFATLPLGVTEDQLLGALDLEHALKNAERRFEPGILGRVNQGVLYVDEVNLLEDHIVDVLLDVAASGVNTVAREGVTFSHPAELVLVGTMNPEEGELRPQLIDRFGLCAEVSEVSDCGERVEIIERCLAYESDPSAFRAQWADAQEALKRNIDSARSNLEAIRVDREWHQGAAALSVELGVAGHRADILMIKASRALGALRGHDCVLLDDFVDAATLVYPHRLRRRPFDGARMSLDEIRERACAVATKRSSSEPGPSAAETGSKKKS